MEKEIVRFEEYNLPIKLSRLNMLKGGAYRGMHSHVAVEVVEVNGGQLYCNVNGDVIKLCENEIIFINSNTGHRLYSENADISYMQIDINFFTENKSDGKFSKLYEFISHTKAKPYMTFNKQNEAGEILNKIKTRYHQNEIGSMWYLKAYIYELIAFMYSQFFIIPPIASPNQFKKISRIVAFVDANFKAPITLDDICKSVNYNKYSVCHYFKAITGATVFDYINFLRVHCAIDKLRQKENSILEIATDCGFSSPTYFNKVFKDVMGSCPSVYRKFLFENKDSNKKT